MNELLARMRETRRKLAEKGLTKEEARRLIRSLAADLRTLDELAARGEQVPDDWRRSG